MFKKVIIAEDIDAMNLGIQQVLKDLNIVNFQHSRFCDDAFLKIRAAIQQNEPYDLLISDLSFKTDHRKSDITSGDELVQKVRELQSDIKIIAYSVEDKSYRIKSLFEDAEIDAFVLKGLNSIEELKKAISIISTSDQKFISPEVASALLEKNNFEIDDVDIKILKYLSAGTSQDEIIEIFKNSDVKPNSKSAMEKRLAKLKDFFKANNTVHLVSITKDMGII
ncbi:response regulator transcription factor [Flavobacterium johnsoniae]|uniref:Response regulator receiver protein n=1 Tax=Flavobacterium johnsoniae (strain ATCC 17061 / DSM 2064 / JCM 8514 / BCRC 14874 / CCUG 350202 / NBRC 14942 / NCIMB 11054 / UW101) TaxID=376686 RepID=A5FAC4_FLAJ1|nr:response regulator transcription factor [Flavobacterium johnsoniae]ABQ07845.1 response regulator receiver protein [Flavobacterium johnsoniae UW101]OXG01925.1 response regulator [Flavobacterium johnsoniae UW101]WQG80311.1 response regulator transcription factor [Flavobacterium johnsoniae UW101]SHL00071.1 DNA-binding response regulator, NarL/FixJ family, contains REC and HTH domains [Flavobacterium johnsoniae]